MGTNSVVLGSTQQQSLLERAEEMARAAIGKSTTVMLRVVNRREAIRFTGQIVQAHVDSIKPTANGRSIKVVWKIVVEAGTNKMRYATRVDRLP